MKKSEYEKMLDTGKVQMSAKNITHVTNPVDINAFKPVKHTHYVEFDVPANSVVKGRKVEWGIIPGEGSIYDKLSIKQGGAGYNAPNVTNIELIEIR